MARILTGNKFSFFLSFFLFRSCVINYTTYRRFKALWTQYDRHKHQQISKYSYSE